jgi:hypothetical protein
MTNNNKFVPVAPKTYEVRYVENKEPSKLFKLASYLGVKTVESCNEKPCYCIKTKYSAAAEQTAAAAEAQAKQAAQYGGKSEVKVNADGSATATYIPPKK